MCRSSSRLLQRGPAFGPLSARSPGGGMLLKPDTGQRPCVAKRSRPSSGPRSSAVAEGRLSAACGRGGRVCLTAGRDRLEVVGYRDDPSGGQRAALGAVGGHAYPAGLWRPSPGSQSRMTSTAALMTCRPSASAGWGPSMSWTCRPATVSGFRSSWFTTSRRPAMSGALGLLDEAGRQLPRPTVPGRLRSGRGPLIMATRCQIGDASPRRSSRRLRRRTERQGGRLGTCSEFPVVSALCATSVLPRLTRSSRGLRSATETSAVRVALTRGAGICRMGSSTLLTGFGVRIPGGAQTCR